MSNFTVQGRGSPFRTGVWGLALAKAVSFCRRKPLGAVGAVLFVFSVMVALLGPLTAPYDPNHTDVKYRFASPSTEYPLGGDRYGRDIFSRLLHGARISLSVGVGATLLGGITGSLLGVISGYAGGRFDLLIQRLFDILMTFPSLVLAMVLVVVLAPSVMTLMGAVALPMAPRMARVMRSAALSVKAMPHIEAAQATGCSGARIVFKHILPNTMAPFLVLISAQLGTAIVAESSLSFLGLGMPPATPSWGTMLSSARDAFYLAPWLAIAPGMAIVLAVLSVNLMGDALRDVLDPKLRQR